MFGLSIIGAAAIVFVIFMEHVETHISLTYPPSRKFQLDYLDNKRTKGPCGMPRQGGMTTSIKKGSQFNVTWHLGLPHNGGYAIDVLDNEGYQLRRLFSNLDTNNTDSTAQHQLVSLPQDLTCRNCIIRLLRAAQDISETRMFWSCADVDIVDTRIFYEKCSGHGRFIKNQCKCSGSFWGSHCQYENECTSNLDCGENGKCIDLNGTALPAKQCFCSYPYFGLKCQEKPIAPADTELVELPNKDTLNLEDYTKRVELSPRFTMHYRLLYVPGDTEIEFVLIVNGTSYAGVGWRPNSLDNSCKKAYPYTKRESWQTHSVEFTTTVNPETERPITHANEQSDWDTLDSEIQNVEMRSHETQPAAFNRMDCTDMVIGSAYENYSRIRDYYTMDLSTPQQDSFWGGTDDLTAATGWEDNSMTTLIFRKRVTTSDVTDHSLYGPLHWIWARGQEHDQYIHYAPLTLDTSSRPLFYAKDELKYHGFTGQRGYTEITFLV